LLSTSQHLARKFPGSVDLPALSATYTFVSGFWNVLESNRGRPLFKKHNKEKV
jgi:hypothetical protein